jgi:hypothetical protein
VCIRSLVEGASTLGFEVQCMTLGGNVIGTFKSAGDMSMAELRHGLCALLCWSDISFVDLDCDLFEPSIKVIQIMRGRCDAEFVLKRVEEYDTGDSLTVNRSLSDDDDDNPMAPWFRIARRTRTAKAGRCEACAYHAAMKQELGWDEYFLRAIGEPTLQKHTCGRRVLNSTR